MLHDIIQNELVEKKAIGDLIYLVESGREIELAYNGMTIFISQDGSQQYCSIWVDKEEQSFASVEDLIMNGLVLEKSFLEFWKDAELLSIL